MLIEKSIAHRLASLLAPECALVLSSFRIKRDGWVKMPDEIELLRKNLGLADLYVLAYENESRIFNCLTKFVFPDNTPDELKKFDEEFLALSEEEKSTLFDNDSVINFEDEIEVFWGNIFPKTEEKIAASLQQFESLSADEKHKVVLQMSMFVVFFTSYFYNMLSLMVHGQKLTTLVPLALQGDKEAFCKAVQIDRNILTGHPYFKETYANLQSGEDKDFLDALLYRIGNPTTRGKIRFPALYMVLTVLDSFHWLDDSTASEILDICDKARLDRFQNRIEDENYLNKRRIEYRRMQIISS